MVYVAFAVTFESAIKGPNSTQGQAYRLLPRHRRPGRLGWAGCTLSWSCHPYPANKRNGRRMFFFTKITLSVRPFFLARRSTYSIYHKLCIHV